MNVYWGTAGAGGTIKKPPLGGGVPSQLASALNPISIVVDATSVYWWDISAGTIMKVMIAGGAATTLAAGPGSEGGRIALDATSVYWTNEGAGTVMKVPK
jgi:hypothetical protein